MAVEAITMYRARCDAPGCEARSSDYEGGNERVYDSVDELTRLFADTLYEGNIGDEYGWIRVVDESAGEQIRPVEKHYCGEHTTWDDETDTRVPKITIAAAAAVGTLESETA